MSYPEKTTASNYKKTPLLFPDANVLLVALDVVYYAYINSPPPIPFPCFRDDYPTGQPSRFVVDYTNSPPFFLDGDRQILRSIGRLPSSLCWEHSEHPPMHIHAHTYTKPSSILTYHHNAK